MQVNVFDNFSQCIWQSGLAEHTTSMDGFEEFKHILLSQPESMKQEPDGVVLPNVATGQLPDDPIVGSCRIKEQNRSAPLAGAASTKTGEHV